jgi:hypothetical protein
MRRKTTQNPEISMQMYLTATIIAAALGGGFVGTQITSSERQAEPAAPIVLAAATDYQQTWDQLSFATAEHWGRFLACHRQDADYKVQADRIEAANWTVLELGIKARHLGVIAPTSSVEVETRAFRVGQEAAAMQCDPARLTALGEQIAKLRAEFGDNPLLSGKALRDAEEKLKALNAASSAG